MIKKSKGKEKKNTRHRLGVLQKVYLPKQQNSG